MTQPDPAPGQMLAFEQLKARAIPLSDAPMIYHLWAAFEKVEHIQGDHIWKGKVRDIILDALKTVTRE